MNTLSDYLAVLPCRLGCTREEDGHEVPLPGVHGGYCERCRSTIVTGYSQAPALIAHLLLLVPNALRSKPAGLGNQRTKGVAAPLPFDVNARDDAEKVWLLTTGTRGVPFGIWPARAREAVAKDVGRLLTGLDRWLVTAEPDAVARLKADAHTLRRLNLRWPTEDRPEFSRVAICPRDGARLLVVPPKEPGLDQAIVCSACGLMLTPEEHERYGRLLRLVDREMKRRVKVAAQQASTPEQPNVA